jgi:hypothetical protein
MTSLHFPESVPGNETVQRLVAIRRKIQTFGDDHNFGIFVNQEVEGLFPIYYLDHIRRFFWREDCLRMVLHFCNTSILPLALQDNLRMVLAYMDEVFNNFVKEIPQEYSLMNTRSKTFDAYLKIEFWVGRHEPPYVRQYRRANERNIDRSCVMECGTSLVRFQILIISNTTQTGRHMKLDLALLGLGPEPSIRWKSRLGRWG